MTSSRAAMARPSLLQFGKRAWWMALLGLCTVLLAPLLVVDVPPVMDYPNHLARLFVLASLPQDPVLARFFASHWAIIPNLALDLAGPPLMHLLPVHVVGRLLIAAAVLLPVLGTIAYNAALNPRRQGGPWWSLGVGLVAYNSCLLYGFLNFAISLGVALLLASAWLRWRENRPALAIGLAIAGAPVLFICHLMGLLFFAVLVGSAELSGLLQFRRQDVARAAVQRAAVLLLVFAAPAALYGVSALQRMGGDAGFLGPGWKLMQLAWVFSNYSAVLDAAAFCVAVWLPAKSLIERSGSVPGPAAIASAVLFGLYLAAPNAWKGTYSLDTRFAVMLGFMLFAGFVPDRWSPMFRTVAATALVLLFLARMAVLTTAWAAHNTDIADLRRALEPVRPGQVVFVAEAGVDEAPAYWKTNPGWRLLSDGARIDEHFAALMLIERRAYWPFEFDIPSQQPIETQQPYRALTEQIGHMPNRSDAAVADVCGFDYVLLLEADSVPDLPAQRFRPLVRSGFATIYAIIQCKADP